MSEDMSIYMIMDKINKYTTYEIQRHNIRYSYTCEKFIYFLANSNYFQVKNAYNYYNEIAHFSLTDLVNDFNNDKNEINCKLLN